MADTARIAAMSERYIEEGLAPSWPASRVAWHVRHPESVVLTARSEGNLAAFAIMQFGDDHAHLNLLAVHPAHRRRGLARGLLRWLEESAVVAGTFIIELELRASNADAFAFYRALGYTESGRIEGYYQGVEAAIRMSRDLRIGHGAMQA